jgi:hypothetical protein
MGVSDQGVVFDFQVMVIRGPNHRAVGNAQLSSRSWEDRGISSERSTVYYRNSDSSRHAEH